MEKILKIECLLSWIILKCTAQKKNRNNRRKTRNITDVERLYDYRNMVTEAFEDEVFPFKDGFKKKRASCV